MKFIWVFIIAVLFCLSTNAQHNFSGYIDNERWQNEVYLSVVDDYRKISGIYEEQIISKVEADDFGYFQFNGNQLEIENKIYKIHVDNCSNYNKDTNHFEGYCNDSKDILFIARSKDTISFPLSLPRRTGGANRTWCSLPIPIVTVLRR